MSLAGKIAVITGAAAMEEKFEPHETANSLAPSLIRTRAVKRITPKRLKRTITTSWSNVWASQRILLMRPCSWPATRIP